MRSRLIIFVYFLIIPLLGYSVDKTEIRKSPLDDREYASIVLKNQLRVVVVSDPEAPTAGAAMVVQAGLYDDPKAFPGLAHFLEHMLFLGTKQFPVPDQFHHYIQSHGGHYNAFTEAETTSYFFSIQPEAFSSGIEQFADFFVHPLFYPEYVDRELNAVEQEFHLNLHKDNWAILEVNQETSDPTHPFFTYFGGNQKTLGYDKTQLQKELKLFFKKHYHASNMAVVLVGPQSTKELISYAQQYFSSLPVTPQNYVRANRGPVYTPAQTGMDIHIKTKGHYRELALVFPFDHERDYVKRKAQYLVTSLLDHEGEGSLTQVLKKEKWITEQRASYQAVSREQDALVLSFPLTEVGEKHIDQITRYAFTAIQKLQKEGVPAYFSEEIKNIHHTSFLYMNKQEVASLALGLAKKIHHMPIEEIIGGDFLLPGEAIDSEAIQSVLSKLVPENMRRMVVSPTQTGDKESKWYHAVYRVEKISSAKLKKVKDPIFWSRLSWPAKNKFLPRDLTLQSAPATLEKEPKQLRDDKITLWHYQDTQFGKPKGTLFINFHVPWISQTPQHSIAAKIYSHMLMESLRKEYYAAGLAGATISFIEHPRGITLSIGGYSDRQDELLKAVLSFFRKFKTTKAAFEETQDIVARRIKNVDQRTLLEKAHITLQTSILSPLWSPAELLSACEGLHYHDLEKFKKDFWEAPYAEMFVYGNYTAAQAIKISALVEEQIPLKKIENADLSALKVTELEGKQYYKQIAPEQGNHVVVWYLQNNAKDYPTLAKTLLLANLIEVPYFQALRVDKQLGYSLGSGAHALRQHSGLMFWIQSTKADPTLLVKEIKSFWGDFQVYLKMLKNKEYLMIREALIQSILQPSQNFEEEAHRWWGAIESADLDFHRREKIVDALKKVNQEELIAFSKKVLDQKKSGGELLVTSAKVEVLAYISVL